jgi:capsular polysaccharide transport system permease protein
MAVATIYFALFAADRYVSISVVGLRASTGESVALAGVAQLLTGVSAPGREDTYFVRDYMTSLGLLNRLDQHLKLRTHYASAWRDPLFRLWGWKSQEDFLDYYRSRVTVDFDDVSSEITLRVEGFDPDFAHRLNSAILAESEHFVNEYSHRIARENLAFAEAELERASSRLQRAKADLLSFQNKNQLLDPTAQAQASGALTADLQVQIAKAETDLRGLRAYLNEDAPQVTTLNTQLQSLKEQLGLERRRSTTGDNDKRSERLNGLAIEFQGLQLQAEIALDTYKGALTAVEAARIESTRKLKSLVVVEPPSTPERAEYPRRWYNLLALLLGSVVLLAIVRMILATIREHRD